MSAERVLVAGWYGAGNAGDELLLSLFCRWARESGADPVVLSIDPAHTRALHKVQSVDLLDLDAVVDAMAWTDLFAFGGGGLLQCHDPLNRGALDDFKAGGIGIYVRPLLLARQLGVPTLLWAQGIGPLDAPEAREIVADLLRWVDTVSVRDQVSLDIARALGVSREISMGPDPAWAYPLAQRGPRADGGKPRLGIMPRPWAGVSGWEDHLVAALKGSVAPGDAEIVWLSAQSHSVPDRSVGDIDHLRSLMDRMGGAYEQSLKVGEDVEAWIAELSACDALIAMRMHSQIIGHRLGLPVFSIEYDQKMSVVSDQVGQPRMHTVRVSEQAGPWIERIRGWWRSVVQGGEVVPGRSAVLEVEALRHREVLSAALAGARPRSRLRGRDSLRFDVLSAWRRAEQDREREAAAERLRQSEGGRAELLAKLASQGETWASRERELLAQLAVAAEDIDVLHAQVARLEQEADANGVRLRESAERLEQLARESERARVEVERAGAAREAVLAGQIATLAAQGERDRGRILDLESALASRQEELGQIYGSLSWRLTAPLRASRRVLGRLASWITGGRASP